VEFGELPLEEAEGGVLAHAIMLAGRRIPKGCPVDSSLVAAARAEGLVTLWVARAGREDMAEAEAAAAIGAALAGDGIEAEAPVHGRVNLRARWNGLLLFDPARLQAANQLNEAIGIATRPPFTPVHAGDLVSTVKIIPYAIDRDMVPEAMTRVSPLAVRPFLEGRQAILIRTVRDADEQAAGKAAAKTEAMTRDRLERLGMTLAVAPPVPHAVGPLAQALAQLGADLALVAGATATADRRDVIPAAITRAGGSVLRVGMPVDPGNLLVLGRLGRMPVVGLPGCARSPKRNGLDLVLERLAAGLEVTANEIAGMGVGGLLEDSGRPVPWGWSG
jgi:molybdenum cofactor cytidylyltransferase